MDNSTKSVLDAAFGTVTFGAVFDALPEITALVALCWWVIRIFETETVKRWTGRWNKS